MDKGLPYSPMDRRVAMVRGEALPRAGARRDRAAGYPAALLAAGLAPDPALLKIGYNLARELLGAANQRDASVAGNNAIARGTLRALTATRCF